MTEELPEEEIILADLSDEDLVVQMHDDLYDGLGEEIVEGTTILLERGWDPSAVLNDALVEGMRIVGIDFRDGILFVPEVLLSANAMKAGMEILRPLLAETGAEPIGKIVIGTVKGDIHDIGKNLVGMMCEGAGFEVVIPTGGDRLTFPGQVLGCNYSGDNDEIGHYLFLGSGDFHPIGLVLHTGKPLALLDPYTGDSSEMSFGRIERILRQRFGLIMEIDNAKTFGILIGEKPGQMRRNLAIRMKRILEKHGRKGYLLALDHVSPDLIDFYPVDAFVNTACPRIAIDDSVRYDKPLVTPYELEVALGEKKWENGYQFDEIP